MSRNILLTTLSSAANGLPLRFFSVKNEYDSDYCDAFLDTEAGIKVILARHPIDDIYIIGNTDTSYSSEESSTVSIRYGKNLYSEDSGNFSTYQLLQYRLAQFADEVNRDQKEEDRLLPEEVRGKLTSFIQKYQEDHADTVGKKLNRLFDVLSTNEKIYADFWSSLFTTFPELDDYSVLCTQWLKSYLYRSLKASVKLDLLPINDDVRLHFIPEDGYKEAFNNFEDENNINLYVSINSDDASDSYILLNMLDILVAHPKKIFHLKKIYEIQNLPRRMSSIVRDDTSSFGIADLFHAIRAFLNYGKADIIVQLWERYSAKDDMVDTMVYSMRHVDVGLSLCNVPEMEKGILSLRKLFNDKKFWEKIKSVAPIYTAIADCIKEDYGTLLEGDGDIPFIDMVKWAYRHQFYQQTLTLIESNSPDNLVKSGIFYYCNDEAQKPQVISLLAEKRLELKSHEYYKMDNIEHYFIKNYNRSGVKRGSQDTDPQRLYAQMRADSVDNRNPALITAFTACDSRKTLENVLYAYYNIGNVRNKISHADAEVMNESRLMQSISDESTALLKVKDAIEYFITCYDKAMAEVQNKHPNVVHISGQEVRRASERMKNDFPAPGRERGPAPWTPGAQTRNRTE